MRRQMDWIEQRSLADRGAALGRRLLDDLVALAALVLLWQRRARERRMLAEMSDHIRRDLGLTEADVLRETNRPFWRP